MSGGGKPPGSHLAPALYHTQPAHACLQQFPAVFAQVTTQPCPWSSGMFAFGHIRQMVIHVHSPHYAAVGLSDLNNVSPETIPTYLTYSDTLKALH